MYVVGLTGGIGAGKSTASYFFSQKGLPVYNSDLSAKILMEQIDSLKSDIIKAFGKQAYQAGGLNTKYLSQKVFENPLHLKCLNALVHPWVSLDFKNWMCRHEAPYCIKETAILFEVGIHQLCDLIITVTAPLDIRIKRIIQRDKFDQAEILKRIKNQWTDREKVSRSDIIIENMGDIETLREKVDKLHVLILELFRKKILYVIKEYD
ncbi:MAG: dephospho-CoA kinase [Flavobacteriales bacterium Tduv]